MMRRSSAACISTSSACCRRREQLHAFLADDDPAKREQLVDELLADNRAYAEHWLSFWNDLLRNDYAGTGYIDGGRKQISALAVSCAAREQAVRPVRARADFAVARVGRIHPRHQVARQCERQPEAGTAVRPERVAGVSGHQHEVRVVPRQLHRPLEAGRNVRPGRDHCRRAAGDVSLRQADRQNGRGRVDVPRAGPDRSASAARRAACADWPS